MKKIVILAFGMFFLASVIAVVLPNGNKILSDEELSGATNDQIQTYMEDSLQRTRYKLLDEKIIVWYNLTYIEPTHSSYTYNDSGENITIEKPYRLFTQEKPFIISIELWNKCLNKTTKQNCRDYLVDRETPYIYEVTENNITTNITIKSTYLKAQEEQIRQYNRAIKFRDKAINNELEELFNLI